jgi:hypothetical protein
VGIRIEDGEVELTRHLVPPSAIGDRRSTNAGAQR